MSGIFNGDDNVEAIYVGNISIDKVYIGNTLLWEASMNNDDTSE